MNKVEIQRRIYELKSEDEIIEFVSSRIEKLENNSKELTVGEVYKKLISGVSLKVFLSKTEQNYRRVYGFNKSCISRKRCNL